MEECRRTRSSGGAVYRASSAKASHPGWPLTDQVSDTARRASLPPTAAQRRTCRLDEAAQSIRSEVPEAALRTLVFDLGAPSSVKTAAKEVLAYEEDIDVLVRYGLVPA